MPRYKYLMNRILTLLMNVVLGQNLAECHSGFRVYRGACSRRSRSRRTRTISPSSAEFLAQAAFPRLQARRRTHARALLSPEASSIGFRDSTVYGLKILRVLGAYLLQRARLAQLRLFATGGTHDVSSVDERSEPSRRELRPRRARATSQRRATSLPDRRPSLAGCDGSTS
jgi:hypothetical protein